LRIQKNRPRIQKGDTERGVRKRKWGATTRSNPVLEGGKRRGFRQKRGRTTVAPISERKKRTERQLEENRCAFNQLFEKTNEVARINLF